MSSIVKYLSYLDPSCYIGLSILVYKLILNNRKEVDNTPCVPVISLKGIIESGTNAEISVKRVIASLKKVYNMRNIKAIALLINSPGGSPVQSEYIYLMLRTLAKEKDVPILAFVEDMAASGGYILACAADKIYASRNSIMGSICVFFGGGFYAFHPFVSYWYIHDLFVVVGYMRFSRNNNCFFFSPLFLGIL